MHADLHRASLAALKAFLWRQLGLGLGVGLLIVLAINSAVRARGGAVSLLSLSHLRERAHALALYGAHRASCSCEQDVAAALRSAALRHGVPYRLVLSLARTESSLVHTRISGVGAMGIMQLMPATARELALADPFELEQNVDGGVRYLKQLLTTYRGNFRRTLAAYNAGPGRVPRRGPLALSAETESYVVRILRELPPPAPPASPKPKTTRSPTSATRSAPPPPTRRIQYN